MYLMFTHTLSCCCICHLGLHVL